jgi:carboxyl-terminal processing protease
MYLVFLQWSCQLGRAVVSGLFLLACGLLLAACGGSSSNSSSNSNVSVPSDLAYVPGQYRSFATFAHRCESPRSGSAYPDRQGSALAEKHFIRSWMHDRYLFYNVLPDLDPRENGTPRQYFMALGPDFDEFYYYMSTAEWEEQAQSGASVGYGLRWLIDGRRVYIAYVEPGSPGDSEYAWGRLQRGTELMGVNHVRLDNPFLSNTDITLVNRALRGEAGTAFTFIFEVDGVERSVVMSATTVTSSPVLVQDVLEIGDDRVGYLLFNSHVAPAETALYEAIGAMVDAGVDDLVLDLRYNGGGMLAIASQLAYMIAGADATSGRAFEALQFNDKHTGVNPFTNQPNDPLPFADITLGIFDLPVNLPLPTLDLPRVFVLSGSSTCSASEAIINSLIGIGVDVHLFGAQTCGKPFGFYPTSNCGTTYFATHFRTVNDQGFGAYEDGFVPANGVPVQGAVLPGCSAGDDLAHPLGDPSEERLAAALHFRETGQCDSGAFGILSAPSLSEGSDRRVVGDASFAPAPRWLRDRVLLLDGSY